MRAIGFKENLPISNENSLQDIEVAKPKALGRDVLVEIKAISVNPADYKIRANVPVEDDAWKIIGWDATGIVRAIGEQVSMFEVGDEVWYAGDVTRQGSYAEYQLVDERLVAKKPKRLSFVEGAALPLTSLTAWELLFDRLKVTKDDPNQSIMVIGAAGGVGSILVQLLKKLTQLKVIATASRKETVTWLAELGADIIINHREKLSDEFKKHGLSPADYILSLNATEQHVTEIVKVIKPQGKFGFIDDPSTLDVMPFKSKSVAIHLEFMFTRSMFQTKDMIRQHCILEEIASLIDEGNLRTTLGDHLGKINVRNLRKAHAFLESGKAKGKLVLEGF